MTSIVAGHEVHPEYRGYQHGTKINQADVALLQYPLGVAMPRAVALSDLNYYTSVTRQNGYFTGNSAYAIAYLALGERAFAKTQFESGAFPTRSAVPALTSPAQHSCTWTRPTFMCGRSACRGGT